MGPEGNAIRGSWEPKQLLYCIHKLAPMPAQFLLTTTCAETHEHKQSWDMHGYRGGFQRCASMLSSPQETCGIKQAKDTFGSEDWKGRSKQ